jgi:hypothetical protein
MRSRAMRDLKHLGQIALIVLAAWLAAIAFLSFR